MSKSTERTFIESDAFGNLVPEINKKATRKKGPGRPVYYEMIFWCTFTFWSGKLALKEGDKK